MAQDQRDGNSTFPAARGVTFTGNVSQEPKVFRSKGKQPYAVVTIAVNSRADKEKDDSEVMFVDVQIYRNYADFADDFVEKGERVSATGDLYLDSYENKDGDHVLKYLLRDIQAFGYDKRWYESDNSSSDDDEDDNSRGRGRRGRSNDDEDEAPARGSSSGRSRRTSTKDEEPEETPRRRRSAAADDDEEPRSTGRRRRRVDDAGD